MRKTWKGSWMFFLLLLCFCLTIPVSASGTVDIERTGSVCVTLKDGEQAVSGAEITLYRVADAESKDGNLQFVFTDAFAGFGGTPQELRDTLELQRLADYAAERKLGGKTLRSDRNGSVRFDGLSLGLYLVVQSGSVQGYSDCTPFLVSVPTESNGEWVYDVDATPKTDMVRLVDITVTKVWNDDGKNRPKSVTVQLQNGNTVVDTVTLNEQNGWSYTWKGQPKGDEWSVKEVDVPKGYTASYQKNGFAYTVTNTSSLNQTGQLKWPIPLLAGVGLLLFAMGWILYCKGKRKGHA